MTALSTTCARVDESRCYLRLGVRALDGHRACERCGLLQMTLDRLAELQVHSERFAAAVGELTQILRGETAT